MSQGAIGEPDAADARDGDAGRPHVFISYAWENEKHKSSVGELARLLRNGGADVWLDDIEAERGPQWARETADEIETADFVLVIASPAYKRRAAGEEEPGTGRGVVWESRLLMEFAFTHEQDWPDRVLNVVLPGGTAEDIPFFLLPNSRHRYELRALTHQGVRPLLNRLLRRPDGADRGAPSRGVGRLPLRVGQPPPPAAWFQDREVMSALRHKVHEGGTTVVCQILDGFGGVGKTQLAAHYAQERFETRTIDLLVWISATSRDAVLYGYAEAAKAVLPESALADGPEPAARAFLEWLAAAPAPGCRWLVVLDDVPDPATLNHLWPPSTPLGRTLLTTRRPDAALFTEERQRVTVGLYTEAEALSYLRRSLAGRGRTESDEDLAALAADLGHLPLALAQAGAYVTDAAISVAEYRALLADQAVPLDELSPEDDALPDGQNLPMARAWALSVERADRLGPAGLARPMLQLISMLSPDGIPETVLTCGSALAHLTAVRRALAPDAGEVRDVTAREARQAVRALHRLSLVLHDPDTPHRAVHVHRLVQRATRDEMTRDRREALVRSLADALADVWPHMDRDPVLAQVLRTNTTALTGHCGDALHRERVFPVLNLFGHSLGHAGQAAAARDYFRRLAQAATEALGPDHADLLEVRTGLAMWTGEAGDDAGALAAYDALIADGERLNGRDAESTLLLRARRVWWLGRTGAYQAAVETCAELLPVMQHVLGEEHPATLSLEQVHAHWQWHAPEPTGQDLAGYRNRAGRAKQVFGPDHPVTFSARSSLAHALERDGAVEEAVTVYAELVDDMQRALGAKDPRTLNVRRGAAAARRTAGQVDEAIAELEQLLADAAEVLGEEDGEYLTVRFELAVLRGQRDGADTAVALLTELLDDTRRIRGPGSSAVANVLSHLGAWRGAAGDLAGAAAAVQESLHMLESGGTEQYIVDRGRKALRHWLLRLLAESHEKDVAGEPAAAAARRDRLTAYPAAADAYAEYIAFAADQLGPGHAQTLTLRRHLANWRLHTGDETRAEADLAALLADQRRALGPHAYDTLITRHLLHELRLSPREDR
ncbi:toll/interleukin-1 receptor domain-containing protein [Streptomyces sp. ISL-22]|uniref:tetratricopeptide repeat protein n=1 Tax=unclassified Streptomyces TaxID=2593676 RepID=UPI001BECA540|nr:MULTISPECIES: toll/interleukin-1 receptor domain-containing protein [unclassified Streptomyces]MBT2421601.1 toll/interleukin-1 receptor domain-containing protein [Streptomyces sp. ISL-24]MBT2436969.1 toll/interleukin-1 receptor domain-containing protein [Streptomyces sp. ISL-22]